MISRSHFVSALLVGLLMSVSWSALAPATASAQDGSEIRAELERTNDLLERVSELARESGQPKAVELLLRARELQGLAWRQFEQMMSAGQANARDARRIATLTAGARDLARRAEQLLREQNSLAERVQRVIEAARRLAEQLNDRRDQANEQQQRRFQEAVRLLELAHRHHQDHEFEIALRLAESAQRLLASLRDTATDEPSHDRLAQELERTRALLDRVRDRFGDLPSRAQQRVEEAARLQTQAENAFRSGQPMIVARRTQQARTILQSILEHVGGNVSEAAVARAAERFDSELARLREEFGPELPSPAREFVRRALDARERAEEAAGQGELRVALSHLRTALELLSRAREELGAGRP